MNSSALQLESTHDASEYPLEASSVEMVLKFLPNEVPEAAQRRIFAAELRDMARRVEEGEGEIKPLMEGEKAPGDLQAEAAAWRVPEDLHMKSGKAAHRFLKAAAELSASGTPPTTQQVAEHAEMSLPPVYRYIDSDSPAGAYLAPLIRVEKRGRAYTIDVTPLGRLVAQRIEQGSLPR